MKKRGFVLQKFDYPIELSHMKPTLFSAIKATGRMHIGNYLGAVKNWVDLQNSGKYNTIYSVVDLHTITIDIDPQELSTNIMDMAIDILACGIDPKKSILFIQSHVKEHAELTWIFNCITPVAELERMTQYKDKAQQHKENVNAGLFDYPVLMAADILLYSGTVVPVGNDQDQHVELARMVAKKFNNRWGKYFEEPKTVTTAVPRLMALNDPTKKMSKDLGPKSYIALFDSAKEIESKIKSAVTGNEGGKNLLDLLFAFSEDTKLVQKFDKEYRDGTIKYSELKPALAKAIIKRLIPIQEKRAKLAKDKKYVEKVLADGAKRAQKIATKNMAEIKKLIGLI